MLELIQRHHDAPGGPPPGARGLYLYEKFTDPPEFVAYREFPERVAGAADALRADGIGPGTRVLFPFETSIETITAFLALLEIGAVPLSVRPYLMNAAREEYQDFLARVAAGFDARHLLATPSLAVVDLPAGVRSVAPPPAGWRRPGARLRTPADDEMAFVQFSSGSTSFPKGVPIRHGALRANLAMILRTDGRGADDRGSSWLPLYHDMGLVGGLLTCLARGNDLLLAEPVSFLFDAHGWWEHLSRERISHSVIPNFAVDYSLRMLRDLDADELAALDLSPLRSVYLGSEPINITNLAEFTALLAPAGLCDTVWMPCYGMAEAVLLVASRPRDTPVRVASAPSGVPAISVGAPLGEFTVRLRGEDGRLRGPGELGEIELAGGSLAAGYLDDARPLRGDDGFYRTGDIGFLDDGELFVVGRDGDRIKVNGQSLFAADFEQAVERLPFVREGRTAVIQLDPPDGRIIVLAEADRAARGDIAGSRAQILAMLTRAIGVTVAESDVHFLRAGQLARTSSGKLRRRAIATAFTRGDLRGYTFGAPSSP
ncbi:AMP-binding protein [Frankia sp. AgB32]|uniref:AMP-binding protein n=1 Tax=Frankia sp. AgB32 TaxID=631119 RepID=UPI00200DA96C|nr:AMP-binding protein [Frankia sp. AgB32]MCK9893937.1 AMP-binding protein [Frankia sp. AgB32]